MNGKIAAVCLSPAKGTAKTSVTKGRLIVNHGLENDAHAGPWHRQVSLLSVQKVAEFEARGAKVEDGAFGENILVDGLDLRTLPVGTRLTVGEALLEVTQIGKECHSRCQIFHQVGDCIMPREGIFARVLAGGEIQCGDRIMAELQTAAELR
ncbi:MAG: MOSC domain-containing protein [Deltaproteobacteria bacterium]|jgi:MOSC domain-containing protein YiiM|nr:MOSC domain-containing protein [Deltaproteobacteria bacterium]